MFEIPDRADPSRVYLRRLRLVQTPWFGVYVHWIYLPDSDRSPHDHPWHFWSWILRGGYLEEYWPSCPARTGRVQARRWRRWSAHAVPTTAAHRILELEPNTVTLVLVGRRVREWGFWTADGWVAWQEFPQEGADPWE